MYKAASKVSQISFLDFNQSCGVELDMANQWVKLAHAMPWDEIEEMYAAYFPSKTGNVAKPARMVLGALIIQMRKQLSDRKLISKIQEPPYLQYFLGLSCFTSKAPFHAVSLVNFCKQISVDFIAKVNVMMDEYLDEVTPQKHEEEAELSGTLIIDATCSPSNIRYPQDFSLLNEAREKLDSMIDYMVKNHPLGKRPRTYRRIFRKEYLAMQRLSAVLQRSCAPSFARCSTRLRGTWGSWRRLKKLAMLCLKSLSPCTIRSVSSTGSNCTCSRK